VGVYECFGDKPNKYFVMAKLEEVNMVGPSDLCSKIVVPVTLVRNRSIEHDVCMSSNSNYKNMWGSLFHTDPCFMVSALVTKD
jgi:hypothetical protein